MPLLFAPTLPLVTAALALASPAVALAVLVLLSLRTALARRLGRLSGSRAPATDWLFGESLLLASFVHSLLRAGTLTWRGRTFQLERGGRMSPRPGATAPVSR